MEETETERERSIEREIKEEKRGKDKRREGQRGTQGVLRSASRLKRDKGGEGRQN